MNRYQRRRKVTLAICLLEEVIADVLQEAANAGEGPMNRIEIQAKA